VKQFLRLVLGRCGAALVESSHHLAGYSGYVPIDDLLVFRNDHESRRRLEHGRA
jgi:hypothetical protein